MSRKTVAYAGPFVTFMLFLGLTEWLARAHVLPGGMEPIYSVFPLQTVVCAGQPLRQPEEEHECYKWPGVSYSLSAHGRKRPR